LDMTGAYPWSGTVTLRVISAPPAACSLAVRVPGWSSSPEFLLNEKPVAPAVQHGYQVIRRQWKPGDVITCDLAAVPRLTYPGRRIDALRGTVAIERGPLVYCAEQADQAGLDLEDLALVPSVLKDRDATLPGAGDTVVIEASAAALPPAAGPGLLPYGGSPGEQPAGDRATVTAIPYFQWDNRDGGPMRVWLPVAQPTAADPSHPKPAQPAEQAD